MNRAIGLRWPRRPCIHWAVIVAALLSSECESPNRPTSRKINGVTARFEIKTPRVRFGERLKVTAYYRNETGHPLPFRFLPAIYAAKILRNGVEELPCTTPEMPYTEVVIQPGQEIRVEDEMPFSAECHESGPHEILFLYHTALLTDQKLVAEYSRKYPGSDGVIPWEDARHKFSVTN